MTTKQATPMSAEVAASAVTAAITATVTAVRPILMMPQPTAEAAGRTAAEAADLAQQAMHGAGRKADRLVDRARIILRVFPVWDRWGHHHIARAVINGRDFPLEMIEQVELGRGQWPQKAAIARANANVTPRQVPERMVTPLTSFGVPSWSLLDQASGGRARGLLRGRRPPCFKSCRGLSGFVRGPPAR